MKQKVLAPQPKTTRPRPPVDSLWIAAGPLLIALLAVSVALYRAPARPANSAAPQSIQSAPANQPVDPVVHNIGKYVASHLILWPELSQPKATPLSAHLPRRHR